MIKLESETINMKEFMNENKKSKLIFDPKIARKLLKQGFVVIDIKPNRENTDKSIFVFENTDEFKAALEKLMDELKAKKEESETLSVDFD